MWHTPARDRLVDALKKPGRSQSWLAERLGLKQPSVWSWVHGHTRPEAHLREALKNVLGIDPDLWMTKDERRLVESTAEPEKPAAA